MGHVKFEIVVYIGFTSLVWPRNVIINWKNIIVSKLKSGFNTSPVSRNGIESYEQDECLQDDSVVGEC